MPAVLKNLSIRRYKFESRLYMTVGNIFRKVEETRLGTYLYRWMEEVG